MNECNFCRESFDCMNLLLDHIRNVHNNESVFLCPFKSCNRSYNIYNSFKKHVAKHNKKNITIEDTSNIKIVDQSNFEQPIIEPDLNVIITDEPPEEFIFFDSDDEEENYSENIPCMDYENILDCDMENYNIDQILSLGLKFVSGCYRHPDVNRKRVMSFINDTKNVCKGRLLASLMVARVFIYTQLIFNISIKVSRFNNQNCLIFK